MDVQGLNMFGKEQFCDTNVWQKPGLVQIISSLRANSLWTVPPFVTAHMFGASQVWSEIFPY